MFDTKHTITLLLLIFGICLIPEATYSQNISQDSLRKSIVSYLGYHPQIEQLLDQLDKDDESNISFLIDNIGLIREVYDKDSQGEYTMPIAVYLTNHPEIISLDLITKALHDQNEDVHAILFFLDHKFTDLVNHLKYYDEFLCNHSISDELSERIKSKRQEIHYQQKAAIPYVSEDDKYFMIFELKAGVDLHVFECLVMSSFERFYETASYIYNVNKSTTEAIYCVPYEKGIQIDENPYQDFISRMYPVSDCGFRNLIQKYQY